MLGGRDRLQLPRRQALAARRARAARRCNSIRIPSTRPLTIICISVRRLPRAGAPLPAGAADAIEAEGAAPAASRGAPSLMAASCALLSAGAARSQTTDARPRRQRIARGLVGRFGARLLPRGRPNSSDRTVVDVAKVFADGQALNFNVTFDALSGASPNGALPSRTRRPFHRHPESRDTSTRRLPVSCPWIPTTRMTGSRSAETGRCHSPGSIK